MTAIAEAVNTMGSLQGTRILPPEWMEDYEAAMTSLEHDMVYSSKFLEQDHSTAVLRAQTQDVP